MTRPHILLITDDQHRWDHYGWTGAVPALETPNWDRLAAGGMRFDRTYSSCPICMPCRFGWLYGLYPSQASAGLVHNAHDWPDDLTSLGHLLQAAGYTTALVGKLHSHAGLCLHDLRADEAATRRRGFDHVVEVSGKGLAYWYDCRWTEHLDRKGLLATYRDRYRDLGHHFDYGEQPPIPFAREDTIDGFIGDRARRWLETVATDRPFFCHASFCAPHFPLDPPEPFWSRYREAEMPPPEGVDDPERIALWQRRRRAYCAHIAHLDHEIGGLLAVLERRGLVEDTLVIYACDHGDLLGWNDRGHKSQPWEFSARTPYLARWPGRIAPGTVSQAPVESIDLPATIAAAAGIDFASAVPQSPARSFLDPATGEATAGRDCATSEAGHGDQAWRMCYADGWKYIQWGDGSCALYQVARDPLERQDRSTDPDQAGRIADLRARLVARLMRTLPPDRVPVPPCVPDPRAARRKV